MPVHRILPDEVKDILDTDLTNTEIMNFIDAANITVTALLGSNTVITAYQLKEIEKYLTAHIIVITRERQAKSETVGDAKIDYAMSTGKGLDGSTYGQMVKMLDTTGTMAADVAQKSVMVTAITSFE